MLKQHFVTSTITGIGIISGYSGIKNFIISLKDKINDERKIDEINAELDALEEEMTRGGR